MLPEIVMRRLYKSENGRKQFLEVNLVRQTVT